MTGRVRLAWLAGLVLVAGCAARQPVQQEVVVSGARFDGVRGEASLVVRTFIADAAGERREVSGATCDATSSLYDATLTTPARLVLPNFGPQSPELMFRCVAGDSSGTGRSGIVTNWRYAPGYTGYPSVGLYGGTGGLAGVAVGWGGWGYAAPAYPVSNYPDVSIELR